MAEKPSLELIKPAPRDLFAQKVQQDLIRRREDELRRKEEKIERIKADKTEKVMAKQQNLKNGFVPLLKDLSSDFLNTCPERFSREEVVFLPQLIARKAWPLAVCQGIGLSAALIGGLLALSGLMMLVGVGVGLFFLTFIGMWVAAIVLTFESDKWFKQAGKAVSRVFGCRSLRYFYYYHRLKKRLGAENCAKYIQDMAHYKGKTPT